MSTLDRVVYLRERLDRLHRELARSWGDLITHLYQQAAAKDQGHVFDAVVQYDMAAVRTAWMDMQELHYELDKLFRP